MPALAASASAALLAARNTAIARSAHAGLCRRLRAIRQSGIDVALMTGRPDVTGDALTLAVTLELLTGRHVLASPPPPPNLASDDDQEGEGTDRSEACTPSSWHQLRAKAGAPGTPIRLQASSEVNSVHKDDAEGDEEELVDAEQEGIAQRLVTLNLPMGLIKASGYSGPSRDANLPPPSTSAILFLNDCLQKMPHLRRHCSVLLDSAFITECKDLQPSVALDWIRDPSLSLAPPHTTQSSSPDQVRGTPPAMAQAHEAGPSHGAPAGRPRAWP